MTVPATRPTVYVETYGCQMNVSDSELMLGKLAATGCDQPVHLVYGVTNDADLVGVEALEDYASRIDHFAFSTCVAAEGSAPATPDHRPTFFATHPIWLLVKPRSR